MLRAAFGLKSLEFVRAPPAVMSRSFPAATHSIPVAPADCYPSRREHGDMIQTSAARMNSANIRRSTHARDPGGRSIRLAMLLEELVNPFPAGLLQRQHRGKVLQSAKRLKLCLVGL